MLVNHVEEARMFSVLCMYSLPGPVLRQMISKDTRILEDSDDESDDDDGDEEDAGKVQQSGASGTAAGDGNGAKEGERVLKVRGLAAVV